MRIDFPLGSNFENKEWEFNSYRRGGSKNKKNENEWIYIFTLKQNKKKFHFYSIYVLDNSNGGNMYSKNIYSFFC